MTTTTEPTAAAEWALLLACEPLPTAWEAMQAIDMVMERCGRERDAAVRMLHKGAGEWLKAEHLRIMGFEATRNTLTGLACFRLSVGWADSAEQCVEWIDEAWNAGPYVPYKRAAMRAVAVLRVVQEVANG